MKERWIWREAKGRRSAPSLKLAGGKKKQRRGRDEGL